MDWQIKVFFLETKLRQSPGRKNRAKINDKCDIREKKQNSSNQTAETAVL